MPRIAIAGFQHETNVFGATPADMTAFEIADSFPAFLRGAAVLSGTEGSTLPIAGFARAAAEDSSIELHPVLWCSAEPSAHVTDDAYQAISTEILDGIRDAGAIDGIYLDLHGAMVTDGLEDGEGQLLALVRQQVGPDMPLVASLDMHANITPQMVANADALTIFRTYPHLDMAETGARAFAALQMLMNGVRLHKLCRHLPYIVPLHAQHTGSPPCDAIYADVASIENTPGHWADLGIGFPLSDIYHTGPCLVAYGQDEVTLQQAFDRLYDRICAAESAFESRLWDPDAAVTQAMAETQPVILADVQDNAGAGAPSDNTDILAALVNAGAARALVGMLDDAATADKAHATGVGGHFEAALGAGTGLPSTPLHARFEVMALSDGCFPFTGEMYAGCIANTGPTAWLRIDGSRQIDVVVSSIRCQALDQAVFRHLGIRLEDYAILSVKSTVHYIADFAALASLRLAVASNSRAICDLNRIPFQRLRSGVRLGPGGSIHNG